MKKSLIALAVASAFAAPAFAATGNVDVYGRMHVAIDDNNNGTMDVVDHRSILGFKGSEDLGGGMKAVFQIERELADVAGGTNAGADRQRNTYVGLAGGFGTVVLGTHDTPYKMSTGKLDIFVDTVADYNDTVGVGAMSGNTGIISDQANRQGNVVAFISPTVSGLTVTVAGIASAAAATDKSFFDATSMSAVYENGPIFASFAYENATNVSATVGKAWKLGLGYSMGDAKVGFIYANPEDAGDAWYINGQYNMGPMAVKVSYGNNDTVTAANAAARKDLSEMAVGVEYGMSKRTAAYAIYLREDNGGAKTNTTSLGIKHSF